MYYLFWGAIAIAFFLMISNLETAINRITFELKTLREEVVLWRKF